MLLAGEVVAKARFLLLDPDAAFWSDNELYGWLSSGLNAIIAAKPDSNVLTITVTLPAGVKQSVPAGGVQFVKLRGLTAAIREIEMTSMDEVDPAWQSATASATVQHVMSDTLRNPKAFWVYPPSNASAAVELQYVAEHDPVDHNYDEISLSAVYEPAMLDYIFAYAYAKNTTRQDIAKAQFYSTQFNAKVGIKNSGQASLASTLQRPGR